MRYVSHLAADGTGRGLLPVLGGLLAAHLQLLSLHVLGAWAETRGEGPPQRRVERTVSSNHNSSTEPSLCGGILRTDMVATAHGEIQKCTDNKVCL